MRKRVPFSDHIGRDILVTQTPVTVCRCEKQQTADVSGTNSRMWLKLIIQPLMTMSPGIAILQDLRLNSFA